MKVFNKAAILTVVGALLLVGGSASPAYAVADSDVRIGTRVSDANGSCNAGDIAENTHVKVCFGAAEDKLYVMDKDNDGRSAYGRFDTGWVGPAKACRNPYGQGTWVVCDYDLPEYIMAKFQGFTQDNQGFFNPEHDHTGWVYECTTAGGC